MSKFGYIICFILLGVAFVGVFVGYGIIGCTNGAYIHCPEWMVRP